MSRSLRVALVVSIAAGLAACADAESDRLPASGFPNPTPTNSRDAGSDASTDDVGIGDGSNAVDAEPDDSGADDADVAPTGLQPAIPPVPEGGCPSFGDGGLTEFTLADGTTRSADVEGTPGGGALILYWHGTGSNPSETSFGLGSEVIDAILADGGMVVAPYQDFGVAPAPWYAANGFERDDDMRFADVIVACAVAGGIDPMRIHSMGFSAGGLQTTTLSFDRATWLASAVTYSGGVNPYVDVPPDARPENPLPALIFHGGALDFVAPYDLESASESWWDELDAAGRFALICNHGLSHVIPLDAQDAVWAFFDAHRFGVEPEPWAEDWAEFVPNYCDRTP